MGTDETKVSIIIPVYNAEKYIRRCIDSVIKQTYQNIEIICIDDGSTDESGKILDEYAAKDARVRVIHKANGGVSSARNVGLKQCGGGYITFIDSDDYVDAEYIETLMGEIEENDAIASNIRREYASGETKRLHLTKEKECVYNGNHEIRKGYMDHELRRAFYFPHGKIYKRAAVGELEFNETLEKSEDILFNLQFLQRANKIKTIEYAGYVYYDNEESITHRTITRYSPLLEHSYRTERELEKQEKRRWGYSEARLKEEERDEIPTRCWNEMANLFKAGNPYNFRERKDKLKEILNCEEFREVIGNQRRRELSLGGRLSKICLGIRIPILAYGIIKIVLFAQKQFLNLFGTRKMKKVIKKFVKR